MNQVQEIPLDQEIPASVLRDAERMFSGLHEKGHRVRVVRIHVDDYMKLIEKVERSVHPGLWTPTILGVPVEPWERAEFGVFAVADDDTPLTAAGGKVREEIV